MFPNEFNNFIKNFIYPHENVYAKGHDGDLNYVITEDVSNDNGGLTKFGIDEESHLNIDIANLNFNSAELIYWQDFISSKSIMLPGNLSFCHFDEVVNAGSGAENHILQSVLGVKVDGVLGPSTLLAAWNAYEKSPNNILNLILLARESHYKSIVNNNPQDTKFLDGWENRINDLKKFFKLV